MAWFSLIDFKVLLLEKPGGAQSTGKAGRPNYPLCSRNARHQKGETGQPGRPPARGTRTLGRIERERSGALCARRAPTIKPWSLDARSEGQSGHP